MTTWTAETTFEVTSRLARIDHMIDSARRTFAQNMRLSAAGACVAGALAKRDALRQVPPIIVGDGNPVPFLEVYDLIQLMEWELQFARAHAMGVSHPDVRPLNEVRGKLQEIRDKLAGLANRDWMDECGDPLSDALDGIDELLRRLNSLDRTDVERVNKILEHMQRFLSCVSDEVDLTVIYDEASFIDSMLEAASKRLMQKSSPRRDRLIKRFLEGAEESKRYLVEYLLTHRIVLPDEPGALDIPPIPDDHASDTPEADEQHVAVVSDIDLLDAGFEIPEEDVSIIDWPSRVVIAGPGQSGPLFAVARDAADDADLQKDRKKKKDGEKKENGDDPRDTPPPVFYGEEIDAEACNGDFVRWGVRRCDPAPEPGGLSYSCEGEIVGYIWPGSLWRGAVGTAIAEINRTFEWYAQYCIHLKLRQLVIKRSTEEKMERLYSAWYRALVAEIGADNLGRATIHRRHINPFRQMMDSLQRIAVRKRAKLLVVFIDEYITTWRPSLVSANTRGYQQVGINWVDSNSTYILAHELIHAFGKSAPGTPGPVTWGHTSGCPKAMSQIARNPRNSINLSGRYLDIAEYNEILQNLGGNVLTRHSL